MSGRPIKILSDFDGVWTDQGSEADAVREFAIAELARLRGVEAAIAAADYAGFVRTVHAAPVEHGWAPDGRITAYVDEDPLCECSAICRYLGEATTGTAATYREAMFSGAFADASAFAEHCFHGGIARHREQHPPGIVSDARVALAAIGDLGIELVVVSNSTSEKLIHFFAHAGIDAGEGQGHELRVHGSAAKWKLGASEPTIRVAGRPIHVDRPRYRATIAEEAPDLVIGDVFSLDLALPHVMRRAGDPGAPRVLVLRRHAHTPAWILDTRADGAIDAVVDGVAELPGVIDRLLHP